MFNHRIGMLVTSALTAIHNLTAILADDGTGGYQPTGSLELLPG